MLKLIIILFIIWMIVSYYLAIKRFGWMWAVHVWMHILYVFFPFAPDWVDWLHEKTGTFEE